MLIYLADLVHDYRPNHFCTPLNIGYVGSFLKAQFGDDVEVRLFKSPGKLLETVRMEKAPDVVGLSNYSWNLELNKTVARRLAATEPETVVIQGGPHMRVSADGVQQFLEENPDLDYYVMLEGEFPTAELIRHFLSKGRALRPEECDKVLSGVAYLNEGDIVYGPRLEMKKGELEQIPSPYLNGMLDEFLESPLFLPLIETNRGCPFACTFCAWGISVLNKVRRFDYDRVIEELKYIAKKSPSTQWYFTDANFGILPRDVDIAYVLKDLVDQTPHLRRIYIQWAKNSSKYCTEIAHVLKGICDPLVAVQSTDPTVLKYSKRDNIKLETMTDLVQQGMKDGIAMTTDVLSGLPGDSLQSHFNTLRDVFAIGFESFNVGQIRMLPGAELESDEDRKKYGLRTKYRLIAGFYGKYDGIPVFDWEESIVATDAMSEEEMFKVRTVHFLTWALWNSGLAQPLLRYLHRAHDINPLDAILVLVDNDELPNDLKKLFDQHISEAKNEWFETKEELFFHYEDHFDELLENEYLKPNLKYLAKILLEPNYARLMLETVAKHSVVSVPPDLVDFCMERIYFLHGRTKRKQIRFSEELVAALTMAYPSVNPTDGNLCRFTVTDKHFNAIEHELSRFQFDDMPVRATVHMLQNYGTKLYFDFSFGAGFEARNEQRFTDSFDYAGQLAVYTET